MRKNPRTSQPCLNLTIQSFHTRARQANHQSIPPRVDAAAHALQDWVKLCAAAPPTPNFGRHCIYCVARLKSQAIKKIPTQKTKACGHFFYSLRIFICVVPAGVLPASTTFCRRPWRQTKRPCKSAFESLNCRLSPGFFYSTSQVHHKCITRKLL